MNIKSLYTIAIIGICFLQSCNQPFEKYLPVINQNSQQSVISTKVVRLGDNVDPHSLLVKLSENSDAQELLENDAISHIEKVFKSTPGKEELEAQFGLNLWYLIELNQNYPVESAINELSAAQSVALVQYNAIASKTSDCKVYSYEEALSPMTKADAGLPFNDPYLIDQWHYYNQGSVAVAQNVKKGADINVVDVWSKLSCGDPSIVIAVVDEGVKYSHLDLAANMWKNDKEIPNNGIDDDNNGYIDDVYGYNFVDEGAISWAKPGDTGHGTHCAGTIAAVNNNNVGVSGVAGGSGNGDGCRIMSCQIFSDDKGGSAEITSRAIKYAADMGASIISCSFGYSSAMISDNNYLDQVGSIEIDAIHYFEACKNNSVLDGNIAIFSSGNDAHDYAHYPGAYHDIISVTAFGPDYLPTYYTNYGPGCNVIAPGGEAYLSKNFKCMVLSTVPSELPQTSDTESSKTNLNYGYMQGTSMACPHLSGITALALSYAKKIGKTFDRDRFKEMIISSANDMDSRLKGTKSYAYYHEDLELSKFFHQLGTGSIDSWRLMMQIEGIPCLTAETGRDQWLDISSYFGTASTSLTYLSVEVSEADSESLGLAQEPYIQYGRLYVNPTKIGSGKVKITAVGGGSILGGGDNPPGGMPISQEISIISRPYKSMNGGWL